MVSEDGHIRFSMLDYYKNEKTYDIDVNPIVHSYRIVDDSVEISFPPEYTYKLYKLNEHGGTGDIYEYSASVMPNIKITRDAKIYETLLGYNVGYSHQGSLQEDSIYISGLVYWDWKE